MTEPEEMFDAVTVDYLIALRTRAERAESALAEAVALLRRLAPALRHDPEDGAVWLLDEDVTAWLAAHEPPRGTEETP